MLFEFVIALGLLILLHEAGHFLIGLIFKFKIEEFGIGYPPRLFKLFTKNGIDFSVNIIPFGGFVRFKGENDPQEKDGFHEQNKWKRLGVMLAGPIMNLLIGIILFSIVFSNTGKAISDQVLIQAVEANTPAATAGLMVDDHILEVNGITIDSMEILSITISENLGKEVTVLVDRAGEEITVAVTPREKWPEDQGPLGIVMTNPIEPIGFFESISNAFQFARYQGEQLISIPSQLLKGEVEPSEVRLVSPKGIYDIYSQVRTSEEASGVDQKTEVLNILWFFGIISVSLGYTNLLPIPALDGGRILFLLPELITGKKIPQKFENMVNLIGFTILIVLMVFVFIQDFTNPIVLPK
jgi:regulator of sigma E protease